jgi:hypothetical protein
LTSLPKANNKAPEAFYKLVFEKCRHVFYFLAAFWVVRIPPTGTEEAVGRQAN